MSICTIQCRFDKIGKCVNDLSQHEALRHLDVRESALCVTFRASLGGTNFRLSTLRSEYVMISLALSTPVPLTTVSVTFGAPLWPVPGRTRQVPYVGGSAMHVTRPRPLTRCSKSVMISLILGAPVPQTTVGVTFRAPLWPVPERTGEASSIGGSAMHVKRPDDVGREAGIGRTRRGQELTLFRACP